MVESFMSYRVSVRRVQPRRNVIFYVPGLESVKILKGGELEVTDLSGRVVYYARGVWTEVEIENFVVSTEGPNMETKVRCAVIDERDQQPVRKIEGGGGSDGCTE